MRNRHTIFGLALLLTGVAACAQEGSGQFEIGDVKDHEICFERAFPLEVEFMSLRTRADSEGIFLQPEPGNFRKIDVVYFELWDGDAAADGAALSLGPPGDRDPTARGEVALYESCPELRDSFYVEGSLVFDEYDTAENGFVTGRIESGRVLSARTGEIVAGDLTGDWSFVVRKGPPYESFRSAPTEPGTPFK